MRVIPSFLLRRTAPRLVSGLAAAALVLATGAARAQDGVPSPAPTATPAAPTPTPAAPGAAPTRPDTVPSPAAAPKAPSAEKPASDDKGFLRPRRLPSWLAIEEEEAPDPPLVKAEAGIVGWPFLRTSIQLGRHGGDPGQEINDVETVAGLPRQAVSPWIDLNLGAEIRVGGSFLDIDRQGRFRKVSQTIDAEGIILANPGDELEVHYHYTQVEGYVVYDILYGARYRIGPIGGVRWTRMASRLRGRAQGSTAAGSVGDEIDVFGPFFGGHIEVDPVDLFTVFADIRFIDWAWGALRLREQRTFQSRLGLSLSLLDGLVGLALDFRFMSAYLDNGNASGTVRSRYTLDGAGVGFNVSFRY